MKPPLNPLGRAGKDGVEVEVLSQWLQARVNEIGISGVAAAVGVTQDRVYRIVTGRYPVKRVNIETAEKFLNAFGETIYSIDPDY